MHAHIKFNVILTPWVMRVLSFCCRYIRMACDCLGPRGDDKSGVRDSWLAYCFMEEKHLPGQAYERIGSTIYSKVL